MVEPATAPRVEKRKGQSAKAPAKKRTPLRRGHKWRQPAIAPLMPSSFYPQLQQRSRGVSPHSEPIATPDRTTTNEPEPESDTPNEPEPDIPTQDTDNDQELDHDNDNGDSDDSDNGPQQPRLMRNCRRFMTLMTSDS